ncbi:hypothetical protein [Streptomyces chryseus]
MIRVRDRSIETAAGSLGGRQGIDDELGSSVICDRCPAGLREHGSMTVARQSGFAPLTGRYVMSRTYFVFTAAAVKSRPIRSGAFAAAGAAKVCPVNGVTLVGLWVKFGCW